eukprot:jgi/Psemu1/317480/estExt_fgenesh1_pm.C_130003
MKGDLQIPRKSNEIWTFIVLPVHIGYRVYLANRMPIMDCDETFNYWEGVHFLLFRGKSFQTWEYSNEFALRTYAYLTPIAGVAWVYLQGLRSGIFPSWLWPLLTEQMFDPSQSSNIALFVFWFFLVGWVTEFLLLSSAGMAHSAAALLPSSTLMGMWLLAAAAYLRKQHVLFCLVAISATLAIGWPFGVLVLVPLGIGVLVREQERLLAFFVFRIIPIALLIQCLVMFVDYNHYGRVVSPLWNILLYNTQAGGDELYGVEPLSYYVKNLVLNLSYVAPVGLVGILPLVWSLLWSRSTSSIWKDGLGLMAPLYLWLAVVMPRPHKEERFLFPIYPSLCLGASIVSVSLIQGILNHTWWTKSQQQENGQRQESIRKVRISVIILAILWIPACTISLSRTAALSKYYSAPLHVYAKMSAAIAEENASTRLEDTDPIRTSTNVVCTCGEWYRFPSSFFIESEPLDVSFGFAPSTFTGQLPQPFSQEGSGIPKAASNRFNDKNKPEPGSYTPIENCDFLIELSTSVHSCLGLGDDNEKRTQWKPIVTAPFFDSGATTSTLHRIFYIPYLHERAVQTRKVQYSDFVLYSKRQKR